MINLLLGFHIMVVTFSLTDKPTVGPFIYENMLRVILLCKINKLIAYVRFGGNVN